MKYLIGGLIGMVLTVFIFARYPDAAMWLSANVMNGIASFETGTEAAKEDFEKRRRSR